MNDTFFMDLALEEAKIAAREGEVPVGAVVADEEGNVLAKAHNRREGDRMATSHAELLAIEDACRKKNTWRLCGCTLYVTLEPCPMCAGAIVNARVDRVVYGAKNQRFGVCGSLLNLFDYPLEAQPELTSGVREDVSLQLLQSFFQRRRKDPPFEKKEGIGKGTKMSKIMIPKDYHSFLSLRQTQYAIKKVKDFFEHDLATQLNLIRVSAPLFVDSASGLNDNLNGVERPVRFDLHSGEELEIVHSLAKWKRLALKDYGFAPGEGLYTDMNAIRRDEETDNIHSMFVDQWDWEKIITKKERTEETLHRTVRCIYEALRHTEQYIVNEYDFIGQLLPEKITFVTAQELEDRYPDKTPKEREYLAAKEYGAVFLQGIGGAMKSGKIHDGRAPDYDDWSLNGDIIVYYPVLDIALELSSMGIRVDEEALKKQLKIRNCEERAGLPFHKALLNGELPYTIGGGIGQSRMCMFFLRKAHIGEVQSSFWSEEDRKICRENGVELL